jgi:hypothetical protein
MAKYKAAARSLVEVENVNVPGRRHNVDGAKYAAMKAALLKILPRKRPGMTQQEMCQAILSRLSEKEFPGGAKAMWWLKTVQLDLEAKEIIQRDRTERPLRWFRVQ